MENIGEAVIDPVVKFGELVSSKHGNGCVWTQWNRRLYGERLWEAFRDLKTAFDPDWWLNLGQVWCDVSLTTERTAHADRGAGRGPIRRQSVNPRPRARGFV